MASVLDIIKHYQRDIEKHSDDEAKVLRCIDKLFQLTVTVQHLQDTGVGRTVNALRKEPGDVGQAARALVLKWKTMVAAEESDQEGDHRNYTTTHNGQGSIRESNDHLQQSRNSYDRQSSSKNSTPRSNHQEQHREINGNHSDNKRKYHSSEEEDHESKKKSRHPSSSEDDKRQIVVKQEKLSDSESSDSDSESSESDSDSYTSESSREEVKVKPEIKQEIKKEKRESPDRHKYSSSHSKHSHSNHEDRRKESSSQESSKQNESSDRERHSYHKSSKDLSRQLSEASTKSNSHKHKSSHDKENSSEKRHKSDTSSDEKKESKSTGKHSSDKHKSSSNKHESSSNKHKSSSNEHKPSVNKHRSSSNERESSSNKHESSSNKHESSSNKHKSSSNKHESSSERHKSSEKHSSKERQSSSHKDKVPDKHKSSENDQKPKSKESSGSSKENSGSSKEKHGSSSKEKLKEKSASNSSKEKPSQGSEKKHSSSESRSQSDKSKHRSDERSSDKKSKEKSSSSSHKSKSSSSSNKSKDEVPKKKSKLSNSEESGEDGIDCGSGASFAEALGMVISPSKPKKKSFKDMSSPNNSFVNDLSPASLLAPTAKLLPLPALEISALPEISPNYRPRPPPKFLPHFSEEDALSASISSKNQRTKVYSGNKVIGKITSLYEMCVHVLQEHIDALEYTGGVPYDILKPVIDRATPQQLFLLEHYNPYLVEDTDHLWQKFCEKSFRNKRRQELESWREMYMRCQAEQETKLKSLTANIRLTQEAKKAPIKQTKMAYVDSIVKPPRSIARKQALHGTAHSATASPASRVASLSTTPGVLKGGAPRPPPAAPVSSSSFNKPKKAPLMAKALQLMRGRKR